MCGPGVKKKSLGKFLLFDNKPYKRKLFATAIEKFSVVTAKLAGKGIVALLDFVCLK